MNVDELVAIDVHTHAQVSQRLEDDEGSKALREQMDQYFKVQKEEKPPLELDKMAEYYRQRKMACVVFPVDSESITGHRRVPNEEVAEAAAANPDVLIPFASIDPAKGKMGAREARRLVRDFGVKGFKFHPSQQEFYPNDPKVYVLYEAIQEEGAIAIFHTGQTGVGAGTKGGGGIRLKYSHPMYLDDVAVDFPDMPIIMAHPSFPWQDEALSIATHKAQVYIDLSGWSPKYFPANLVQYANSLLKHKVLFGTDYPVFTPERWLADFEKINIKPEVRPLILKENAAALLKLRS